MLTSYFMTSNFFLCKNIGKISAEIHDVNYLFENYQDQYRSTFQLKNDFFISIWRFKKKRGGFSVILKKDNKFLAAFTLSDAENNFLELGDVFKFYWRLSRAALSEVINWACLETIKISKKFGVYAYPNASALELEKLAGFKFLCNYKRNVYFVFLFFCILLPIEIYNRKIFAKNIFIKNLFYSVAEIYPIIRKQFGFIRIFRKKKTSDHKKLRKLKFGLFFDFVKSNYAGDPVLIFSDKKFKSNLNLI